MEMHVIDFNDKNAKSDFCESLKWIGFAVFKNHPVDHKLVEQLFTQWEPFFHSEARFDFLFEPGPHDGYIPLDKSETAKGAQLKDLKHFYHFYKNGRCPENLLPITRKYHEAVSELAGSLLSFIEWGLPDNVREALSMPLSDMIKNSENTLLRILHYPPLTGDEPANSVRAAPHEDINLITLLPAATESGLQVQNANGNFIDVPSDKGWLIVNTGDMLEECTRSYYKATTHRVMNPSGRKRDTARLSCPLFLHPRDEVRLSERHTAGSFRRERYHELGLDS